MFNKIDVHKKKFQWLKVKKKRKEIFNNLEFWKEKVTNLYLSQ